MGEVAEGGPIPALALIGAGALLGFTMLAVVVGRTERIGLSGNPDGNPVASVALRVLDRPDGSIRIEDAADARLIEIIEPGQDNFVRATLRSFGQSRLRAGLTPAEPFRLTRYDDGSLALIDETTGRSVNMGAFGPTNALAFAKLLPGNALPDVSVPR
ncbi:putative photosynthetic complex assembly protein PuhC [Methylobacterium sp. E-025]|uniref:photosynthetic complex assembly protein PuhC n=1 Tax=Methylobacterium sp. E-025 TaxID=2836561 RepID=UPI001FB8EAF9|nr:photosynthetic complex assembly protein PuhC [Methylobacterium sp. E-025]MCJ2110024.1 putative photosynthetic complex assembly protein PuhC [Methylobacterium sp. E-025]